MLERPEGREKKEKGKRLVIISVRREKRHSWLPSGQPQKPGS